MFVEIIMCKNMGLFYNYKVKNGQNTFYLVPF